MCIYMYKYIGMNIGVYIYWRSTSPPALRARSNRLFQVIDLFWRYHPE